MRLIDVAIGKVLRGGVTLKEKKGAFMIFEKFRQGKEANNTQTAWDKMAKEVGEFTEKIGPRYEKTPEGDVRFRQFGDIINFGETNKTRKLDEFLPADQEDNDSVTGIKLANGDTFYFSEGVMWDKKNDKFLDLVEKRIDNPDFTFPSVAIGYKFPYDKIPAQFNEAEGEGANVIEVRCFGVEASASPESSSAKQEIYDRIHGALIKNEKAKSLRPGIRKI